MLQCCPSCKEGGVESRLRFHYLAFDWGLWLCPREDCTFPLGHEDLDSFMVKVSNKSSGGSLSSLSSVPDVDDVSLCSLNADNPGTMTAPSQPSTTGSISSNSHYSYVHLTGSGASKHGDSGHFGSNTNSHTVSPSGHSYTGNHSNTTTEAAVTQDGYPPHPPEISDSTEMDADKEIAELLGLLGPEQPTSMHW